MTFDPASASPPVDPTDQASPADENQRDLGRGLYDKYTVARRFDRAGKHRACQYFVLDLQHDQFAGPVLLHYAALCEALYPALAADLRRVIADPRRR